MRFIQARLPSEKSRILITGIGRELIWVYSDLVILVHFEAGFLHFVTKGIRTLIGMTGTQVGMRNSFFRLENYPDLPTGILAGFVNICNKNYACNVFIGSDNVYHELKDIFINVF